MNNISFAKKKRRPSRKAISENKIIAQCSLFLSSRRLSDLRENLPDRQAPWEESLKKALALWSAARGIEEDGKENAHVTELWEILCILIKANYYLQNKVEVQRLQKEAFDEYALHAAVGVANVKPSLIYPVVERLLRLHSSQLQIKEFVHGRLPLHVAAATSFKTDGAEILLGLLDADPHAAKIRDDRGIYPLHLACQARYPRKSGLEQLYKAAPHVGELTCPCCPAELLAQQDCYDRSLETVYALSQEGATFLD